MQEKEWFAEWFDTPYYHVLYKDRNDDEAAMFIENLISFLELPVNSSILDLVFLNWEPSHQLLSLVIRNLDFLDCQKMRH